MPDHARSRMLLPGTLILLAVLVGSALVPGVTALDVSTKAIRVVGSQEYPESVQSYSGQVSGFTGEFNGEGIAIAILDTGVDDQHRTFDGAFVAGAEFQGTCSTAACFRERNPITDAPHNPDDADGHGTHVASIALGRGGGEVGPRGVASGARLVDVKISSDVGGLSLGGVAAGIRWVVAYHRGDTSYGPPPFPVKVISISFASTSPWREQDRDEAMKAVKEAHDAGILVVAAAGNCGPGSGPGVSCSPFVDREEGNTITSPGAAPEALTVGAIDDKSEPDEPSVSRNGDEVAGYSSRGPNPAKNSADTFWRKPDVVAPGSRIRAACASLAPGNQAGSSMSCEMSGTSMATPHVSGLAAILFQAGAEARPGETFTPQEVKDLIRNSADDWGPAGWDPASGYGYVDAYKAMVAAINRAPAAKVTWTPPVPEAGEEVVFDASGTRDPDDQDGIERLLFDFGDGSAVLEVSGREVIVQHTYDKAGAYTVTLTAIDSRGSVGKDIQTLQVEEPPPEPKGKGPNPVLRWWPAKPMVGEEVHFDAGNSTDPDGHEIQHYQWDFDYDGENFQPDVRKAGDPRASWTFETVGPNRVALRVVDEKGLSGLRSVPFSVLPPPPGPPVLEITNPKEGDRVQAGPVLISWIAKENPADTYTVFLDGEEQFRVGSRTVRLDLTPGDHAVRVLARGPGGSDETTVNFTAVEGEALATNALCQPTGHEAHDHSHGDATECDRATDRTNEKCVLHTRPDGKTETLCGDDIPVPESPAARLDAAEESSETPVPPLLVLLAALGAALPRGRRRAR